MRGPKSRHKHAIIRTWECPACGKRAYSLVQVVNRACSCRQPNTWMRLIEEPPRRKQAPSEPQEHLQE